MIQKHFPTLSCRVTCVLVHAFLDALQELLGIFHVILLFLLFTFFFSSFHYILSRISSENLHDDQLDKASPPPVGCHRLAIYDLEKPLRQGHPMIFMFSQDLGPSYQDMDFSYINPSEGILKTKPLFVSPTNVHYQDPFPNAHHSETNLQSSDNIYGQVTVKAKLRHMATWLKGLKSPLGISRQSQGQSEDKNPKVELERKGLFSRHSLGPKPDGYERTCLTNALWSGSGPTKLASSISSSHHILAITQQGKYLVLFFYPLDFTFVNRNFRIAFSDKANESHDVNCELAAVSMGSHFSSLA
ncbi:hypothetical protein Celaphus_00016356, partial [Cervus elaphus hippelaphus]